MFWAWVIAAFLFYNFVFKYLVSLVRIGDLRKKAVVITGCDSGFGRDLTKRCLKEGFTVFAACFSKEGIETLKAETADQSTSKLFAFQLDVRDDGSVNEARKFVDENLGDLKLHALVNNAGIPGVFAPDAWCPIETYKITFDVNFFGMIRVVHAFSPLLKRDAGRIVNMASMNGRLAFPFTAPYCTTKCAVNGYSDIIRRELRPYGIKVIVLEPSFYKTPLMALKPLLAQVDKMYEMCPPEEKQFYDPRYPDFLKAALQDIDINFCSPNTQEVIDAYWDAVTCQWPELRLHPGFHSKYLGIPSQFLSTWVQDLLHQGLSMAGPQPPPPPVIQAKSD